MSAAHRPALVVVGDVDPSPIEAILAATVPALIDAECAVVKLRELIAQAGRELARERGVAFIREESIRREFGNG